MTKPGGITTIGGYLSRDLDATEQRWVEVEPLLFRAEERDEHIAFRQVGEGGALYLFGEADPTLTYEKVSPHEAPGLRFGLLAGDLAVFLLTALGWPVGAGVARWRRRRDRYGKSGGEPVGGARIARQARPLAWAVSVLALLFVTGMALVISNAEETLAYGASPSLIAVLTLPLLVAALSAGVLFYAALVWKRGYWSLFGRLHYSLVALSALTFVALLAYYNLLGYRF